MPKRSRCLAQLEDPNEYRHDQNHQRCNLAIRKGLPAWSWMHHREERMEAFRKSHEGAAGMGTASDGVCLMPLMPAADNNNNNNSGITTR